MSSPAQDRLPESLRQRELEIARQIAQAFLAASRPLEVYRLALAKVTPLVEASFGSIFLRDEEDASLLRLVCAQNWPQSSARYLGQMRIRVGRGPTGRAVAEGTAVEVENVFAEPGLREWWEPAREMGFTSLISLPLMHGGQTKGALSFYFAEARRFEAHERALLTAVTEQLAATAERAQLLERLQVEHERLERERLELEAKLRRAETSWRRTTELLGNVGHELRAPLESIVGEAEQLGEDPVGRLSARQRTGVERIGHAGSVALRLVGRLADLSRLRLGHLTVRDGPEEAGALLRRAADAAGAPPADVAFRIEQPDGSIPLTTDGEKLACILENLLSNAFKYTRSGEVVATVRRTPMILPAAGRTDLVEWEVRDSGIGMRGEELATIFDEFEQVDGSSTRLYGGTGLGLALSRGLAQLLGGEIVVDTEAGAGSTFTLRLPLRVG